MKLERHGAKRHASNTDSIVDEKVNLGFGVGEFGNVDKELIQESCGVLYEDGHEHLGEVLHLHKQTHNTHLQSQPPLFCT